MQHRRRERARTPRERLDAREQLLERERLRDVVVGAGAQRLDLRVDGVLRGEHEHGALEPVRAQRLRSTSRPLFPGSRMSSTMRSYASSSRGARLPRRRSRDPRPPMLLEPALHVLPDRRIVLDDENSHATLLHAARPLESVLADLPVERLRADAERRRGAALMPVRLVQHGLDVAALELRERHGGRRSHGAASCAGSWQRQVVSRGSAVPARAARRARSRCAARARCPATDTARAARARPTVSVGRIAPCRTARRNCRARSGMSTARSRSGGSLIAMVLMR